MPRCDNQRGVTLGMRARARARVYFTFNNTVITRDVDVPSAEGGEASSTIPKGVVRR